MIQRIARFCYHHRRLVLVTWLVVLIAVSGLNAAFGGVFKDDFTLPDSESEDGFNLMEKNGFGEMAGFSGQLVFKNDAGFDDATVQGQLEGLFTQIESDVSKTEVVSPFTPATERQIAPDGTIAYAEINMAERDSTESEKAAEKVRNLVEDTTISGTELELGGMVFMKQEQSPSEAIGLVAAAIILFVAFGSLVAMGLPIVTALCGIGTGIALVGLAVNLIGMPSFSTQAVMMIGLGVGIDYALFIVTRYRESLQAGAEPEHAVVRALDTSGRAVIFAGTTVILAVLGLFAMGMAMMNGLAIGIALGVLMTMIGSMTLLPAFLGFVGRNIDKFGLPHSKKRQKAHHESIWYRWSRVIQRRPWPALLVGAVVLLLLAAPLFSMRLGLGDAGNNPRSDTTRRAFDLLSDGFGPGFNGPFLLVAETLGGAADLGTLDNLSAELNQTKGVAFASPPQPNSTGKAAIMQVVPTTSPQAESTSDLVHRLRDETIPQAVKGTDVEVLVSGQTPAQVDFSKYMGERLPWFMAIVLTMSFVLLMCVFRSLLVPLKAVIMNLISIGAAYGILVMVFQWGWGASLIGVDETGPIEMWLPMMLFAVVFGLSMDYEVFLLSRIREEYDRLHENATAVANGLAATARVITAAALIMVCVFGAFVLGDLRALKMMGFGLAVAVFLDATVVRMILVPATMELLGDANWWLPRWLDRILPRLHVEGGEDPIEERPGQGRGPSPVTV